MEFCVEFYAEYSVELRFKRVFEHVKVVPLSRYSTGLRALLRGDQVVMQPTIITLPTLPTFPSLLLPLSLASSALSKLSLLFFITSDLNRHFGATSASLRIKDKASMQPLCSEAIHKVTLDEASRRIAKMDHLRCVVPQYKRGLIPTYTTFGSYVVYTYIYTRHINS